MEFIELLKRCGAYPLSALDVGVLQVNLGYRCNMSCKHCHVEAGPSRPEMMEMETVSDVLVLLKNSGIKTLDITGGAPELNPHFRYLIREAKKIGSHVMVRSNLTIFFEAGMNDLPEFYKEHEIELIASLPYYSADIVDRVRGDETFSKSIDALKTLNAVGFGTASNLKLDLVYNPQGIFLPPPQAKLEEEYRKELGSRFGISFDRLFTFANMPLGRFKQFLIAKGQYAKYMQRLEASFNEATLQGIMCRHLVSVGWNGVLYDCDFNQVAGFPLLSKYPQTVKSFDPSILANREISFGDHCYACTAGQGST